MIRRFFITTLLLGSFILSQAAQPTAKKGKDIVITPPANTTEQKVVESFDFNNVDVMTLVKQISRLTGKRFIVEEKLASKKGITIVAPTSISVQEAYDVFLSVLDTNGLVIVKSGPMLKIVEKKDAISGVTMYRNDYFPRNDEYITKLIKLENVNAQALETDLTGRTGLVGNTMKIKALGDTNTLVVTGTGSQIADLVEMIKLIDIKGDASQLAVMPVKNADAGNLKDIIFNLLFQSSSSTGSSVSRVASNVFASKSGTGGVVTRGAEKYANIFVDERTNSIIVLANNAGIKKIRSLVKQLDFEVEGGSGIHIYPLKNARAEDISKTLNSLVSAKAGDKNSLFDSVKITDDKWTNSIVVSAKPKQYEGIKNVIAELDRRKGQVLFETITMEIALNDDSSFGISSNYALSSEVPRAMGFDPGVSSSNTIMNFLTNPSALSGMILGFGSKKTVSVTVNGTSMKIPSLAAFITALEKNSEANVLQRPSIITSDNEEATIKVMDKIPVVKGTVVQQGISQQNIENIDVGLSLKITPRINEASDFIKLDIEQETSDVTDKAPRDLAGTTTATNSRNIKTSVIVRDKDTVVIGGLYRDNLSTTYNKVPILGDIPILGWFFKGKTTRAVKTNLLVFITPNIVRDYETHSKLTLDALQGRKGFIKNNFGGEDKFDNVMKAVENKIKTQISDDTAIDEKAYLPESGVKPLKIN